MLSGYYLSEHKGSVHAGRLFRIGARVWFYSMLTFCVAVKAGAVPLSAVNLLRALLPSLAYLTGAVLLIAVAGYAVDAVYQRLYRLLRLPALETKLDALTACILQRIVGSEKA